MPKDKNGNYIAVYHLDVRYIYLSEEPGHEGMREKSMTQLFIANNHYEAVVTAKAWAEGRFEAVIKDTYKNASLGSLTVNEYFIENFNLIKESGLDTLRLSLNGSATFPALLKST